MNILSSWLREWVNPNVSDKVLAEQLTIAGLEVDSINPQAPMFDKVLVGKVLSSDAHPNADKLSLCQVDVGEAKHLQIICGAKNVRAGLKVMVATVGAKLPGGLRIKKTKLRGVESQGMICSATELGMEDATEGITELAEDAPIGEDIRRYLNLDDNTIELDITPNRGDCFSVLGVAREVSINYNMAFKQPNFKVNAKGNSAINPCVSSPNACPKYLTRTIIGIDNTVKTPRWIAEKLTRCGHTLHSPVVDISNFVLLELGQPTHAFDLSKISGDIVVRLATAGEKITLLNETVVDLKADTLVIADKHSVLAIAGVMGGADSATQTTTTDILLESAFFTPLSIAGKARDYGLHTESSLRFERGVDFQITELAMDRVTQLIVENCGGQASEVNAWIDEANLPQLAPIKVKQDNIQKILGFELAEDWILEKFNQLGFEIINKTKRSWTIIPPSFRFDIRIPADLIEELARLYGYDKLPVEKLFLKSAASVPKEATIKLDNIKQNLVSRGYQEVITYSFIAEKYHHLINPDGKKIVLSNPISAELSIMRSSLWAGLLQTLEFNQRRGHTDLRLFEAGLCFGGIKEDQQTNKLAGVISGNRFAKQWSVDSKALDFFDAKGDVESLSALMRADFSFSAAEHPALQKGQTARIFSQNLPIGWVGAVSPLVEQQLSLPECYLFEIDLSSIAPDTTAKYQALSAYQQSQRDIALVLDEAIPAMDLIQSIQALQQEHFVGVNLFDVYRGENIEAGKKSIALNLTYQSLEGTLTDDVVTAKINEILTLMQDKFSAQLR